VALRSRYAYFKSQRSTLEDPRNPVASQPLRAYNLTPDERHKLLYDRRRAFTTKPQDLATTTSQHYRGQLHGFARIREAPDGFLNRKRGQDMALDRRTRAFHALLPDYKLRRGVSGLSLAEGERLNPRAPAGRRGTYPARPPRVVYGRRPLDVPISALDALAGARTLIRSPDYALIGPGPVAGPSEPLKPSPQISMRSMLALGGVVVVLFLMRGRLG